MRNRSIQEKTQIYQTERVIVPRWGVVVAAMDWAKQYPDSYTVYSAGLITYITEADLTMYLIKWA